MGTDLKFYVYAFTRVCIYVSNVQDKIGQQWHTYLLFMPGLVSTVFSELDKTRIVTSPAPALRFLKNLFTLFSKCVPNFDVCNSINTSNKYKYTMSVNDREHTYLNFS